MSPPQSGETLDRRERAMWWVAAMAMQSAAGPPAPVAPLPVNESEARCDESEGDEVVVCARRDEPFRLRPLPERYVRREGLPKAEVSIAGVKLAAESEAGQAAGGGAPPRAMVRLKLPF